jgi:chromosomal replication initiator protein
VDNLLANAVTSELSSTSTWQTCLSYLQEKVDPVCFATWFRATSLAVDGGLARVQVPSGFAADFIEQNFAGLIREALVESAVSFETVSFEPVTGKDWRVIGPLVAEEITEAQSRKTAQAVTVDKGNFNKDRQNFNPNYTFDSFVVGDSNSLAHAAARAVADAPGKNRFNPLIIYGGTGLGKTHLLQAIGNFALTENTADSVVYMTSEEFTNQYIDFVVNKKDSVSFYKKFNDADILLIDDIQFFSKKPGVQTQFSHIFDRLLMKNKQIVLSSDRLPENIPDMMEHIINRFKGGMNTDIQPPDLETRMAILRKKAESDELHLPDEVVQYIAGQITTNVRVLEGMLVKLIASSSFTDTGITLEIAQELCGGALNNSGERVTVKLIMQLTAEAYGVSVNQLSARSRKKEVVLPRSVAMYLSKKWTKQSLNSIGFEFGRDHSTVVSAVKKIETELADEAQTELRGKVAAIEEQLKDKA